MFKIPSQLTEDIIFIIKNIPRGKVLTYGRVAKLAGHPKAARQVSWTLHSSSGKYDLPWHRVINSKGEISLKFEKDRQYQKALLEKEGIEFLSEYEIDLDRYIWKISSMDLI